MIVLSKYCGTPGEVVVTNEVSNGTEREHYLDSTTSLPEDATLTHHKPTVVHWRLAGQQTEDARRELLRFESRPGGVERWRNKPLGGLSHHLWRCQHRRDQRT